MFFEYQVICVAKREIERIALIMPFEVIVLLKTILLIRRHQLRLSMELKKLGMQWVLLLMK